MRRNRAGTAFCPSFRSHGRTWHLRLPWGWNTGEYGPIENNQNVDPSELHNADVEPICRKFLDLRYRLLPYNYTLAREACDTGLPMMRALWLHYPDDAEAVKLGDEYLWGRDLLVAPVVKKAPSRGVSICRKAPGMTGGPARKSRAGAGLNVRLISLPCPFTSGPAASFRLTPCANTRHNR